jgi:hypothetical protein
MADVVEYSHAASDMVRTMKSKFVSTSNNGGNRVFVLLLPRKCLVTQVWLDVKTAYTGASTGSILVGYVDPDGNDADFFIDNTDAAPTALGLKKAPVSKGGRYFEKGGSITISLAKGDSAADISARIFADTRVIY